MSFFISGLFRSWLQLTYPDDQPPRGQSSRLILLASCDPSAAGAPSTSRHLPASADELTFLPGNVLPAQVTVAALPWRGGGVRADLVVAGSKACRDRQCGCVSDLDVGCVDGSPFWREAGYRKPRDRCSEPEARLPLSSATCRVISARHRPDECRHRRACLTRYRRGR